MSTRCTIEIKEDDKKLMLYHHCDGYIKNGVGDDLKKFLSNLSSKNIYWSMNDIANNLIKNKADLNDEGYKITIGKHGDSSYEYFIDCDKRSLSVFRYINERKRYLLKDKD